MALVNTKEMFKKAYEGGYSIGAFNISDLEQLQGCLLYTSPSPRDTR